MTTKTILIVEDNDKLTRMYDKVLKHAGYETICTPSVQEAIQLLIKHEPAAVCLDWRLEDGTGAAFLDYVRTLNGSHLPKILIISAQVTKREVAPYVDLIEGYYTKPIALKEMVQKVTQ